MKKTFFILICLLTIFPNIQISYAVTPTPTVNQELLQAIASKTAQLNLVEKKGIIGIVNDASDTQISLTDSDGNIRFVDVDELTKFSSPSSSAFGISDVTKGMRIGVLGLYNKQSKRILAREVTQQSLANKVIYGAISSIDKVNFEITIVKESGEKIVAEIENITKSYSYSQGTISKSGFSKITAPQTVIVIGTPDKQDPNKILAARIILFPDISISPNINLGASNPTIIPSTGSGKKLTPIVK